MSEARILAAEARGYMQGALKLEETGDPAAAREYFLKAAEAYLAACRISESPQQRALWKNYAGFLINKANSLKKESNQRVFSHESGGDRQAEAEQLVLSEKPNVYFDDIIGLEEVKERLKEAVIYPFTHAEEYRYYHVIPPRGILFYGPPGCGKTYLAKAAATESDVAFIRASVSDIVDKFVGESEKMVQEIFELARNKRRGIIFLDELDAIAMTRAQAREGYERRLVNELLSQMDGLHTYKGQLLVLGATNRPWDIDPAFLRAGRLSTGIFIPHPDFAARRDLFKLYLMHTPTSDIDYDELAERTVGFEAARIPEVCNEAGLILIRENIMTGKLSKGRAITMADLDKAIEIEKRELILPTWYAQSLEELQQRGQAEQFPELVKAAQEMLTVFNGKGVT